MTFATTRISNFIERASKAKTRPDAARLGLTELEKPGTTEEERVWLWSYVLGIAVTGIYDNSGDPQESLDAARHEYERIRG